VSTHHHPRRPHPNPDPGPAAPVRTTDEPVLYTPAEAAHLLRVRESWLRRRAAARLVPCTFLGKHLRFSPTDLATIVTAAARPATGRRPRRRTAATVRDRDLPTPDQRSVHAHRDDPEPNGSSPWHG
jgi:hypothetical protein